MDEDAREELIYRLLDEFRSSVGSITDEQKYAFIAGARSALVSVDRMIDAAGPGQGAIKWLTQLNELRLLQTGDAQQEFVIRRPAEDARPLHPNIARRHEFEGKYPLGMLPLQLNQGRYDAGGVGAVHGGESAVVGASRQGVVREPRGSAPSEARWVFNRRCKVRRDLRQAGL